MTWTLGRRYVYIMVVFLENIYWSAKVGGLLGVQSVIEVARLNGSHRYIVIASQTGNIHSLQVDPVQG